MLQVRNLKMYYKLDGGWLRAIDDVSCDLEEGSSLGVVGESGCGKSSLALSILRLFPENGRIMGGKILFNGENILEMSLDQFRKYRWKKISVTFQNAMSSLDPIRRVMDQLTDILVFHAGMSRIDAKNQVTEFTHKVGISTSQLSCYPHELSGGMKQRIAIVMSLLCNPDLLILDEPTTALDVVVQDQIIRLIKIAQKQANVTPLLISHDVSLVTNICKNIAVMYAGKIVESADTKTILRRPSHPYTVGLFQAFPDIHGPKEELVSIPGLPPDLRNPPSGCLFQARCPRAERICKEKEPHMANLGSNHMSLCHFADDTTISGIRYE